MFDETAELGVVTYSKRFILGIWTYVIVRLLLMYQDLGPEVGRASS